VVLDRVELYDIAARILEGSMIVEATGFSKELPLQIVSGALKMEIIKDGIYLFADGKVVVVDGKTRDSSNGLVYGKGYEISDNQGYRARKVKTFTTALELWSQKRDADISRANLNVARSLRQVPDLPIGSLLDVWLWYPAFGSFIYMPGGRYRSPYGYRFQTAGEVPSFGGGFAAGSGAGGGSNANAGGSGSNSNANSGSGGGGGGVPISSATPSTSVPRGNDVPAHVGGGKGPAGP
jgi:hypothetical protein